MNRLERLLYDAVKMYMTRLVVLAAMNFLVAGCGL